MKRLASPVTIASGCVLILLTNVAVLSAAAWNRRGDIASQLELTERELALPEARQDDGGAVMLSLFLAHEAPGTVWRTARWKRYELPAVDYDWLDRAKLRELGCSVDVDPSDARAIDYYTHAIERRVFLVLEYEGEAWTRWLAGRQEQLLRIRDQVDSGAAGRNQLEDAEALLALDRSMRSRLFVVDAGPAPRPLRQRYRDRRRFAVVAGFVRPEIVTSGTDEPYLIGRVVRLAVERIHVSRKLRPQLQAFLPRDSWEQVRAREQETALAGWPSPSPPRYRAVLAWGQRREPWLVGLVADSAAKSSTPAGETPGPD